MEIQGKNVLIIGCPASGKTYYSELFKDDSHEIIHTDDFMQFGFEQSLYELIKKIQETEKPTIIEGVLGYRLLRKGVQLGNYFPDIVIELKISEERMMQTYSNQRDAGKIKYLRGFLKANQTVLNGYFCSENEKKPEWVIIKNDY